MTHGRHNIKGNREPFQEVNRPDRKTDHVQLLYWLASTILYPSRVSRDGVVRILARLRTGWSGVPVLAEAKQFSLIQNIQTGSGAQLASSSLRTASSSSVGKAAGA